MGETATPPASSDRTVRFGLGSNTTVKRVETEWPCGIRQKLDNVRGNRYIDAEEAKAK